MTLILLQSKVDAMVKRHFDWQFAFNIDYPYTYYVFNKLQVNYIVGMLNLCMFNHVTNLRVVFNSYMSFREYYVLLV